MRLLLVFLFTLLQVFLFSQTIVIQPMLQDGKDVMIDTTYTLDSASYYQNRGNLPVANIGVSTCLPDGFTVICRSRLLIQFPLEELGGDTAFSSAFMTLYTSSVALNSVTNQNEFNIKRVVSEWDENTVLWMTQPQVDTSLAAHFSVSTTTSDSIVVEVSETLKRSLANPATSHGFLMDFDVWGKDGYVTIYTSEFTDSLKRPKLTVNYNPVLAVAKPQLETRFFAYPSPVHDRLFVQCNDCTEIALFSSEGQMQLSQEVNAKVGNVTFDVTGLLNGLYILRTRYKTEETMFKRIVIEH